MYPTVTSLSNDSPLRPSINLAFPTVGAELLFPLVELFASSFNSEKEFCSIESLEWPFFSSHYSKAALAATESPLDANNSSKL